MKKASGLFKHVVELDNLYYAFWKASKGKRYAGEVLSFQADLEDNLLGLQAELLAEKVSVGSYRYFKVYEPKERQICASAFREQVIHHALINVTHPVFERALIFDSYASRKSKGTYAALAKAKIFTHQYDWFLKLDVRKFFESINHNVLKKQLTRLFKEPAILNVFFQIIDSYEASPNRGLPIGNLTSQYFANHFLSGLDHMIKEKLRIRAYVRYMDDLVLWDNDKAALKHAFEQIRQFVEGELKCALKPEQLNRSKLGLPFLGYRTFPNYVQLLQKSKLRFIKKATLTDGHYHSGYWHEAACQKHILPLLAFIEHADSKKFQENVISQW